MDTNWDASMSSGGHSLAVLPQNDLCDAQPARLCQQVCIHQVDVGCGHTLQQPLHGPGIPELVG